MKRNLFEKIIGSWTLVELLEVPLDGGTTIYPMGRNPKGLIIYNRDGYMSAQIMNNESKSLDSKNSEDSSNEETDDHYTYLAYSGPFVIDEEKQIVSHTMFISLFQKWRNQTQNRKVYFENELLHLETENFRSNSRLVTHKLTWKKAEKSSTNH
ncbi:lipocalin-like domain-containing protein [Flavobacterium artemisiae]|uniref:Lipocalin-like domain-containing protein n=1 Tax=Flavobacterium artemisiae TaxID=2126556 RepID=A0ABW4HH84_9FLAO